MSKESMPKSKEVIKAHVAEKETEKDVMEHEQEEKNRTLFDALKENFSGDPHFDDIVFDELTGEDFEIIHKFNDGTLTQEYLKIHDEAMLLVQKYQKKDISEEEFLKRFEKVRGKKTVSSVNLRAMLVNKL